MIGARRAARLDATREVVERHGRRAVAVETDVTSPDDCERLVQAACDSFGRVDVLVNCAGVVGGAPATREAPEDFRSIVEVNLFGSYWMAQAAARRMAPGLSIINVSSVLGLHPCDLPMAGYVASKAGLLGLTRELASQLSQAQGDQGQRARAGRVPVGDDRRRRRRADLGAAQRAVGARSHRPARGDLRAPAVPGQRRLLVRHGDDAHRGRRLGVPVIARQLRRLDGRRPIVGPARTPRPDGARRPRRRIGGGARSRARSRRPRRATRDAVAIHDDAGSISYRELWERSDAFAHALRDRGIGAGRTVGLLCGNHRWFVVAMVAARKAGADLVLLNPTFPAPEIDAIVAAEGIDVLVHDDDLAASVAGDGGADDRPDAGRGAVVGSRTSVLLRPTAGLAASSSSRRARPAGREERSGADRAAWSDRWRCWSGSRSGPETRWSSPHRCSTAGGWGPPCSPSASRARWCCTGASTPTPRCRRSLGTEPPPSSSCR